MTQDPASIAPVRAAALRAVRAWRVSRAVAAGQIGGALGLAALALHGAGIELTTHDGVAWSHAGPLAGWLALGVVGAVVGFFRSTTLRLAAHELDQRAGLDDRLGTALAFAALDAPLARLQRADANAFADVAVAPLFPPGWGRRAPLLAALLLLCVLGFAAAVSFDLGPSPAPVVEAIPEAAADLLAAIELEKELLLERGDKEGARLLDDLSREVQRIQVQRHDLRRKLARRAALRPSAPAATEEPVSLPPPAPAQPERKERSRLITAEDLERLEADTLNEVQMSEAQVGELVSELFSGTRTARTMNEAFHHHVEHEMDAMVEAANPSMYGTGEGAMEQFNDTMASNDMLNMGAQSARLSETPDVEGQGMDIVRRDLSAESQATHDSAHDMQQSFNEFLQEFVKDMQQTVAEAALGKKRGKDAREVKTNAPSTTPDKRDAMAEAGFEEMGDSKRATGEAPPESSPAGGSGESGEGAQPGPPPDDLSGMQLSEGDPGDGAVAMRSDAGGGTTSAGAQGAGSGDPSQEGRSSTLLGLARLAGPLDAVLGAMGEGALPAEERKQLFEQLARHSVQAGLASEADDVLLDYFQQAEELISEEDALSPLFRDYATSYFEAIRPGGARSDGSQRRSQQPGVEPRPVP